MLFINFSEMRFAVIRKYSVRLDPRNFKIASTTDNENLSVVKFDVGVNSSVPCHIKMIDPKGRKFYYSANVHSISRKNLIGIAGEIDEETSSGYIYDENDDKHVGDYFQRVYCISTMFEKRCLGRFSKRSFRF